MTNSALLKIAARNERLKKVRHNTITGGTWKKSEVIAKVKKEATARQ